MLFHVQHAHGELIYVEKGSIFCFNEHTETILIEMGAFDTTPLQLLLPKALAYVCRKLEDIYHINEFFIDWV